MAATAITGNSAVGQSIGATHDTWGLSVSCKQLAITNQHATQSLYVACYTGPSAAAAAAKSLAGTAVTATSTGGGTAAGPVTIMVIPPATRKTVSKSVRPIFYSIDILGSGASTTFSIEGTSFQD